LRGGSEGEKLIGRRTLQTHKEKSGRKELYGECLGLSRMMAYEDGGRRLGSPLKVRRRESQEYQVRMLKGAGSKLPGAKGGLHVGKKALQRS